MGWESNPAWAVLLVLPLLTWSAIVFGGEIHLADKGGDAAYTDPVTGMEFVKVKGACYQMGDTFGDGNENERPVHEVCLEDFYIGKYDVTQGQWKTVMGNNPSCFQDCGDNCPVEEVSWNDAHDFIKKLNRRTGRNYRLPTEAEWEYAARSGGKHEKWSGTSSKAELVKYAWYSDSANWRNKSHPVGTKRPNGLGLYDMSGNVWQWVEDWYAGNYYGKSPRDNPVNYQGSRCHEADDAPCGCRVLRGGGWGDPAVLARSSDRLGYTPDLRSCDIGFRLSRTP